MKRHFIFNTGHKDDGGGHAQGAAVENQLTGQATAAEIAAWKGKYPIGIYAIQVEGHVAYFKNPDFNDLNFGFSKAEKDAALDVWKALAEATKIGGSEMILTEPALFTGAMKHLQAKANGKKAVLLDL